MTNTKKKENLGSTEVFTITVQEVEEIPGVTQLIGKKSQTSLPVSPLAEFGVLFELRFQQDRGDYLYRTSTAHHHTQPLAAWQHELFNKMKFVPGTFGIQDSF